MKMKTKIIALPIPRSKSPPMGIFIGKVGKEVRGRKFARNIETAP